MTTADRWRTVEEKVKDAERVRDELRDALTAAGWRLPSLGLDIASPTYEAECASGDAVECGAESGPHHGPGPVEEWMRGHAQDTGHRRYLRIYSDYAIMRPPSAAADGGTA